MTPEPRRYAMEQTVDQAVDQAIAAERLEGLQPTAEHTRALVELAHGDVPFADYLSRFRDRHPPPRPHRRRRLTVRRATPYFVPGTTLLRNKFGADTAQMLADIEFVATAGRMVQWLRGVTDGGDPHGAVVLDPRLLHGHLFGDVYAWAGEYRTTELRRGDHGFAWQSTIAARMARVRHTTSAVVDAGAGFDAARLAYELARLYADYNQIHPFREGNGRAGALLLHGVAMLSGRLLDMTSISRSEWYQAAADSMPLLRDGRANHRPFIPLLVRAVRGGGGR